MNKNLDFEYPKCNFCQSNECATYAVTSQIRDVDIKSWRLARCKNCGLIFANPRLTIKSITDVYNSGFVDIKKAGVIFKLIHFLKKWKIYFTRIIKGKKGDMVVDVGSGDGYFLLACQKRGYRVLGVDIDENLKNSVEKKFGIKVMLGEFASLPIKKESVDHVTMYHMLEHSYDPMADIRMANSILKPGGLIYIEVPNVMSLEHLMFKKVSHVWEEAPSHVYHFDKKSLENYLSKTGFKTIKISYPFFAPYIFSKSIIRSLSPNIGSRAEFILMMAMFPITLPVSFLASLFRCGTIINITAQKTN